VATGEHLGNPPTFPAAVFRDTIATYRQAITDGSLEERGKEASDLIGHREVGDIQADYQVEVGNVVSRHLAALRLLKLDGNHDIGVSPAIIAFQASKVAGRACLDVP
jgi:hypothetical protein